MPIDYDDDVIRQALMDADVLENQAAINLSEEELTSVSALANEMARLEDLKETLETVMKTVDKSLIEVRQVRLPAAMENLGLKSIELSDKSKLTISIKYIGSITKDNEDEALEWFKETGRAGVITPMLSVVTQKGRLEEAEAFAKFLQENNIPCALKPSVHWQTLRAVVREIYEAGETPPDCISTHVINEATLKRK